MLKIQNNQYIKQLKTIHNLTIKRGYIIQDLIHGELKEYNGFKHDIKKELIDIIQNNNCDIVKIYNNNISLYRISLKEKED